MKKKTYVTYAYTDYVVRKEQNQVICQLKFHIDLPEDIAKLTSYLIEFNKDIKKFFEDLNLYNYCEDSEYVFIGGTTYGYADCMNDDEFDDSFGKKLAQTRAQMKAFDIANKVYLKIVSEYNKLSTKLNDLALNAQHAGNSCFLHTKELIDNKYNEFATWN